jgi:hypothetical protein
MYTVCMHALPCNSTNSLLRTVRCVHYLILVQAMASLNNKRRSTFEADVVLWSKEIDTLLELVQVRQLLIFLT